MTKALEPAAEFTSAQVELIKRTIAKGASNDELQLFLGQCRRTGLDPFSRQIYAIQRWNNREKRNEMVVQVSIDGFRLIAARTGLYEGSEGPLWCGKDGEWRDVWLSESGPWACKVGVWRNGCRAPFWGVATFKESAQTDREGKLTHMWARLPAIMLAKTAEALALRRAFPQELSGLYSVEEVTEAAPAENPGPERPPVIEAPAESPGPERPWRTFGGMIEAFAQVHARLGPNDKTYYEVLAEFGVEHANQFKDLNAAAEAHRRLRERADEYESMRDGVAQ